LERVSLQKLREKSRIPETKKGLQKRTVVRNQKECVFVREGGKGFLKEREDQEKGKKA